MGKKTNSGVKAEPYLQPTDYKHTGEMIKSSLPFLDWTSPDTVIMRAELYMKDGYPVKAIYTNHLTVLRQLKKLRNHFAHNSAESHASYLKVIKDELGAIPPVHPRLGEFLLSRTPGGAGDLFIHKYLDSIERIAQDLCD